MRMLSRVRVDTAEHTAEDLGVPGRDDWYGWGLVNVDAAAAYLAMAAPGRGKLEQRVRRILAPVREAGVFLRAADLAVCGSLALLLVACGSLKPVVVRTFLGVAPWSAQEIAARLSADPFPGER